MRSDRMRSDLMKKGVERAMNRALFYASGFTKEDLAKPIVGVANTYNQIVPGHIHLNTLAEAVVRGVADSGGTSMVFPGIAVCDGIAMGHEGMKYSLASIPIAIYNKPESLLINLLFASKF